MLETLGMIGQVAGIAGSIGQAVGGIGQAYQAFTGSGMTETGYKRSTHRKQLQTEADAKAAWERRRYKETVAGARAAGVHPLYALGTGGSYTPSPAYIGGGSPGTDFERVGMGMQSASTALKSLTGKKDPNQAAMVSLGLRQAEAETRKSEIGADLAALELQRERQKSNQTPPAPDPELPPLYIKARDPYTGEIIILPNQELGIEMPEAIGAYYWGEAKGKQKRHHRPLTIHVPGSRPASGRPRHLLQRKRRQ